MPTIIDKDRFANIMSLIIYLQSIIVPKATTSKMYAGNLLSLITVIYILAAINKGSDKNNINMVITIHQGILDNLNAHITNINSYNTSEEGVNMTLSKSMGNLDYQYNGADVKYHNLRVISKYENRINVVFIVVNQNYTQNYTQPQKGELDDFIIVSLAFYTGLLTGMNRDSASMYPIYLLSHDKFNWLDQHNDIYNYFNKSIRGQINFDSITPPL
jgi:hypothetical protein